MRPRALMIEAGLMAFVVALSANASAQVRQADPICAELQRHGADGGTVTLPIDPATTDSTLIKAYRQALGDPRLIAGNSRNAEGCGARLENYALLEYRITGIIPPYASFAPDVRYNPLGAALTALAERSPYPENVKREVVIEASRLLLPEALIYHLIKESETGRVRDTLCTLALAKLPRRMAEAVTASGRCGSHEQIGVDRLVGSAVAQLSDAERRFCEGRRYDGYGCLVGAARARSLCNGDLRLGDRHYRLALCADLSEVSSVWTDLNGR